VNKFNLKSLLLLLVSFFFLNYSASAQKNHEPTITKRIGYLKTPNKQLEAVLRKWRGTDTTHEIRYHYNKIDLNGDKKPDAIVFVSGDSICGTGGCELLIFKGIGKKFELITETSVSRPPIWVSSAKTKGWSDLIFYNSGGGIKPYYSHLKFDGKSYPENPSVEPEVKGKIKVIEYLSGIDSYETGFLLK
jgi:hypothetical protein